MLGAVTVEFRSMTNDLVPASLPPATVTTLQLLVVQFKVVVVTSFPLGGPPTRKSLTRADVIAVCELGIYNG